MDLLLFVVRAGDFESGRCLRCAVKFVLLVRQTSFVAKSGSSFMFIGL